MMIQVTQFMRPDGRQVPQTTNISNECQSRYEAILESKCRLTAEVLTDGKISLCIESKWGDYDMKLVSNGPEIITTIEAMLQNFTIEKYEKWVNEQMAEI